MGIYGELWNHNRIHWIHWELINMIHNGKVYHWESYQYIIEKVLGYRISTTVIFNNLRFAVVIFPLSQRISCELAHESLSGWILSCSYQPLGWSLCRECTQSCDPCRDIRDIRGWDGMKWSLFNGFWWFVMFFLFGQCCMCFFMVWCILGSPFFLNPNKCFSSSKMRRWRTWLQFHYSL